VEHTSKVTSFQWRNAPGPTSNITSWTSSPDKNTRATSPQWWRASARYPIPPCSKSSGSSILREHLHPEKRIGSEVQTDAHLHSRRGGVGRPPIPSVRIRVAFISHRQNSGGIIDSQLFDGCSIDTHRQQSRYDIIRQPAVSLAAAFSVCQSDKRVGSQHDLA